MLEVNTKAPFNITQKALPAITKSKGERLFYFVLGQQIHFSLFKKVLEDISLFSGPTDTPVWDFCWPA